MTHKKFKLGKNGFTLIELLAVLVVLAIIALIAIPIVLKIVKDSEESAQKRSVELYAKAVENAISDYQLKNKKTPKTYDDINVEYNGKTIDCNKKIINEDGSLFLADCYVNGNYIKYTYGKTKKYNNGEIVYFDVELGEKCSLDEYFINNSLSGYNGINNSPTQNHCLKFYSFNDSENESNLKLILDHNTTHPVSWNSSGNTLTGPSNILKQLALDTNNWNGTEPLKKYKVSQYGYSNYIIDYTGYKARLITAEEVAKITGAINLDWNENSSKSGFYFDTNSNVQSDNCKNGDISGCKYGWLYDRTASDCKNYGCLNNSNVRYGSYWTATSSAESSILVWFIGKFGDLSTRNSEFYYNSARSLELGLRPVIEVSKDKLK